VEILEAIDESFRAKKLTKLISQNLKEAKEATIDTSPLTEHPIPNWYTVQIPNSVSGVTKTQLYSFYATQN
jgi:hypothetical protein